MKRSPVEGEDDLGVRGHLRRRVRGIRLHDARRDRIQEVVDEQESRRVRGLELRHVLAPEPVIVGGPDGRHLGDSRQGDPVGRSGMEAGIGEIREDRKAREEPHAVPVHPEVARDLSPEVRALPDLDGVRPDRVRTEDFREVELYDLVQRNAGGGVHAHVDQDEVRTGLGRRRSSPSPTASRGEDGEKRQRADG